MLSTGADGGLLGYAGGVQDGRGFGGKGKR